MVAENHVGERIVAVTIHGIRVCDTIKKARSWLDANSIDHVFHDYKTQGISEATLRGWVGQVGWKVLLNRAGTTFRKLPGDARDGLDKARAIRLMLAQPSMIKRPVLEADGALLVGFRPDGYAAQFGR